jgi:hypothetical protein
MRGECGVAAHRCGWCSREFLDLSAQRCGNIHLEYCDVTLRLYDFPSRSLTPNWPSSFMSLALMGRRTLEAEPSKLRGLPRTRSRPNRAQLQLFQNGRFFLIASMDHTACLWNLDMNLSPSRTTLTPQSYRVLYSHFRRWKPTSH